MSFFFSSLATIFILSRVLFSPGVLGSLAKAEGAEGGGLVEGRKVWWRGSAEGGSAEGGPAEGGPVEGKDGVGEHVGGRGNSSFDYKKIVLSTKLNSHFIITKKNVA